MSDFQECCSNCHLTDMSFYGPLFTWCNKRVDGLICRKLDRVLINDHWLHELPQSYCVFEAGSCSDHQRCRFYLQTANTTPKKRPLKFANVVASLPHFLPAVEDFWRTTQRVFHSTSAMFRFSKKLKDLKPIIRQLSREALGDISKKVQESYALLCEKPEQTLNLPTSENQQEEGLALERWEHV